MGQRVHPASHRHLPATTNQTTLPGYGLRGGRQSFREPEKEI